MRAASLARPLLRPCLVPQAMETSTSDYDREKLQERLAKLSGGVAVLKVGPAGWGGWGRRTGGMGKWTISNFTVPTPRFCLFQAVRCSAMWPSFGWLPLVPLTPDRLCLPPLPALPCPAPGGRRL